MDETKLPKGYVGKILRVDLTDRTVEEISTYDYVPEYIGGKALGTKIFYDEVGPGVKAFDPENELIFMTGPTLGTGLPAAGRCTFVGIAPNSYPEQFAWSGLGGYFGLGLKQAGYDGFILRGKASEPLYLYIDDGEVEFCSAEPIWGKLVHQTQNWLFDEYGREAYSIVIGPGGENLCRNASITTSADNVAAKSGFGAVMGSKNLKAVCAHGTGDIVPGDVEKVFELRHTLNAPYGQGQTNPVTHQETFQASYMQQTVPGGWDQGWLACCPGCTMRCNLLVMNTEDPFTGEIINQVEKCVSPHAYGFNADYPHALFSYMGTDGNHPNIAQTFFPTFSLNTDDPQFEEITATYPGNKNNFWKNDWRKGNSINTFLNEYGLDKWDFLVWYLAWISGAKQEGLIDDLDFGMEIDIESEEFVRHFIEMVVYREGIGDIFAEGMSRAMRMLGKEKYGDPIYHNFTNAWDTPMDVPVSQEVAWGQCPHWIGRGYQSLNKPQWVQDSLQFMTSTRDSQSNAHQHERYDDWVTFKDDPCRSQLMADIAFENDVYGDIKESILGCDWSHHSPWESDVEARMFSAATGLETSEEQLFAAGVRSKLLMRAILIRNYSRTRDLEVEEMYPWLTWPDPWGQTCTWDEWNDAVDRFYHAYGYDLETGWPYRSTYEKYGLGFVADDMERIGKLPAEGGKTVFMNEGAPPREGAYRRKPSPFVGHWYADGTDRKAGDVLEPVEQLSELPK